MNQQNSVHNLLIKGTNDLKDAGIDAPVKEAGALLSFASGKDISWLYAYRENRLPDEAVKCYIECVKQRKKRIPMQHITKCQEFMSLVFEVNKNVLIPRQDTEILLQVIIDLFMGKNAESNISDSLKSVKKKGIINILDLGTGSGCIAAGLAHYLLPARITAVDISPEALAVAGRNVKRNKAEEQIRLCLNDILAATDLNRLVEAHKRYFNNQFEDGKFDCIVSNPPYIPSGEIKNLQEEVLHDPAIALDGGIDGMVFYRHITSIAETGLEKEGILAFETGYDQAFKVEKLMLNKGFKTNIYKDLSGLNRVVIGEKK